MRYFENLGCDKKQNRHGFSITEVLISISIISVLAVLLTIVLKTSQNKIQQIECIANLRQIGNATLQYSHDHGMQLPGPLYTGQSGKYWAANNTSIQLIYYIIPYLGLPSPDNQQRYAPMFYCPSLLRANAYSRDIQSYAATTSVFGYPEQTAPLRLSSIRSLATTYALSDFVTPQKALPHPSHPMRNFFFLDGHTEQMPWGF